MMILSINMLTLPHIDFRDQHTNAEYKCQMGNHIIEIISARLLNQTLMIDHITPSILQ